MELKVILNMQFWTNEIYKEWAGNYSTKDIKQYKGLRKENLTMC